MASGTNVTATTADNQYFYEDEVFRIDKKGRIKFGLVLENSGSFSSDDEDYFDEILCKGEIRVVWHPDGKEEVLNERAVGLADRTLMPGDVVRRLVPGKDTQRGYCHEINMKADVKIVGTKYVVKNVMAERLKPLLKMPRDNAVCLDSWVGSTKCVKEKVVLKSSCGAIFEVNDLDLCQLKDANTKIRNGLFADTIFYPGQTVSGRIESLDSFKLLTPTVTLKTNKKGKPIARKFVVQSVQIEGVWVRWQCKALSDDGIIQQPAAYVTGDDLKRLKRLNLFESCMLQINDKNYLKIMDCDVIVRKSQWEKEQAIKYKLMWNQQQKDQKDDIHKNQQHQQQKIKNQNKILLDIEKMKFKVSTTSTSQLENKNEKRNIKSSNLKHTSGTKLLETTNNLNKERNKTDKDDESENTLFDIKITKQQQEEKNSTDNPDDWQTEEDDEIDGDEEIDDNSLAESTTLSTCSSPTPRSSPKRSPLLHKKQVKRLKKTVKLSDKMPEIGDEVVTEALVVYSTATVVWQDGTVETGIPSTQLYPIHHLDDHEFFPGDFVLSGAEGSDISFRDYGVIQTVDHQGRTAHVKWFTTYTCSDEQPRPTYTGESEVSVYDLKDHPDFQYRPGTIVIRVANFVGEDATCTAGQIIDNYTDGRVKVWWVDGHISMCWPQDLFEVGQHDPENNIFGNNDSDDNDSWETESEDSEPGGIQLKSEPRISINLERARVAISRLEEIFMINPSLQNHEVMRKLLVVYKTCRYLDRLMGTSFFHEDHFMGLIERVRKGGNQSKAERAQDQKNRLFNQALSSSSSLQSPNSKTLMNNKNIDNSIDNYNELSSPLPPPPSSSTSPSIFNVSSSTPFKTPIKNFEFNLEENEEKQKEQEAINLNNSIIKNDNNTIEMLNSNNDNKQQKIKNLCQDSESILVKYENTLLSYVVLNITKATLNTEGLNKKLSLSSNNIVMNNENNQEINNALTITTESLLQQQQQQQQQQDNEKQHDEQQHQKNDNDSGNCSARNNTEYCDGSSTSYNSSNNDLTNNHNNDNNLNCNYVINNLNNSLISSSSSPFIQQQQQEQQFLFTNNKQNNQQQQQQHQQQQQFNQLQLSNDLKSISSSSIELIDDTKPQLVCARLCTLLKNQLVKALHEIQQKYFNENLNLSEVIEYDTTIPEIQLHDGTKIAIATCDDIETLITQEATATAADVTLETTTTASELITSKIPETPINENNDSGIIPSSSSSSTIGIQSMTLSSADCFQVLETAPSSHKFHLTIFHPSNTQQYYKAVRREHKLLRTSLPPGVWVRVFEDRMDLLSVMIEGPKKTPYEDGMFFFDIQLGRDYPKVPPLCHYISYCADRLNPNLYEDGKVCVSLLGTWSGKDSEVWSSNSTLLQVIVSIQGLILVSEPYFNEAGYEKQKGTQQGKENSRMYNEMVIIKLVQSMTKLLTSPPEIFREQILQHFKERGKLMYNRIKQWMEISQQNSNSSFEDGVVDDKSLNINENFTTPEFPLVPASRGFCLTLSGLLDNFYSKIEAIQQQKANE